jgi:hypothetical protein
MTTTGPLEQLEALDQRLSANLASVHSLSRFLAKRLADSLPRQDVTALRLGTRSLPEAVIAQLDGELNGDATVLQADGTALGEPYDQRLLTTIRQLGAQLPLTAVDLAVGFWKTARWPGSTLSALHGLAAELQQRWRAQMDLRREDQTLDGHSIALMQRALAGATDGLWLKQLCLKAEASNLALPGVFVIGADSGPAVLLHSLAFGFEAFASLPRLEREFSERLDDPRQGSALLAPLTLAQRQQAWQADTLHLEPLRGELASTLARDLRDWQVRRLREAWEQRPAKAGLATLEHHLNSSADLAHLLHRRGALQTRYALLLARHMLPWFKNTAEAQKINAMQAIRELILAMALARTPALPSAHRFSQRDQLLAYAATQLRQRLRIALGIDLDPHQVMISTTKAVRTGALLHPLQPSSYIAGQLRDKAGESVTLITHRRSLAVLALENLSMLDLDFALTARVSLEGAPAPRALTPSVVKNLVRRLSLGSSYRAFVQQRLLRDSDAQWRRERYRHLALARMRYEAYKSNATGRFLAHPQQRGFTWACRVLDQPLASQRQALAGGERLQINQLLIQEATIGGVLLITAAQAQAPANVVVYTPAAPDRRSWREYASRMAFLQAFADDPALLDYLVNRASLGEQGRVRAVLLNPPGSGSRVRLAAIDGDFIERCYDAEVRHILANVQAQAISTAQLDSITFTQVGLSVLELMASLAPAPIPFQVALARALGTLWEGMENRQDREIALQHFMSSITYLGDVGISLAGSPVFARAFRNLPLHSPSALNSAMAVPRQNTKLRYRIDGIYREGVYETLGEDGAAAEYLIEDRAGRRYKIEFDGEYWHIIDARQPQANLAPQVRRNAAGDYEIVSDLYWQGSRPDLERLLTEARLQPPPEGLRFNRRGMATRGQQRFLQWGAGVYEVRKSLVRGRYRLLLTQQSGVLYPATVLLRRDPEDRRWQILVKQTGISSPWLELPISLAI